MRRASNSETVQSDTKRARVASRLRGAARVLIGRDPLPQSPAPKGESQERRIPRRDLEPIKLEPGNPTYMHNQKAEISEQVGRTDRNGNNRVATFELPGREGRPVNFSVICREDGLSPITASRGYASKYGAPEPKEAASVTVMPTNLVSLIALMNKDGIGPDEFSYYADQIGYAAHTVQEGEAFVVGRGGVLRDSLGDDVSAEHLTISLTNRLDDGRRSAMVGIADHSLNGTDNVTERLINEPFPGWDY